MSKSALLWAPAPSPTRTGSVAEIRSTLGCGLAPFLLLEEVNIRCWLGQKESKRGVSHCNAVFHPQGSRFNIPLPQPAGRLCRAGLTGGCRGQEAPETDKALRARTPGSNGLLALLERAQFITLGYSVPEEPRCDPKSPNLQESGIKRLHLSA